MKPNADLVNELKKANKLLALLATRDLDSKSEQIKLLHETGFKASEIAMLIGTTPNSVSVAINKLKKSKKK